MDLKKLQDMQIEQMKLRNSTPKNGMDVLLHLVEEVGEVCEAVREEHSTEKFESEVADVFWQLNKLCWIHNVNLEKVFLEKLDRKRID